MSDGTTLANWGTPAIALGAIESAPRPGTVRSRRGRVVIFAVAWFIGTLIATPAIGAVTHLAPVSEAISARVWCSDADTVTRQTSYTNADRTGRTRTSIVCHSTDGPRDVATTISKSTVAMTSWGAAVAAGMVVGVVFGLVTVVAIRRRGGRLMLINGLIDAAA